MSKKRLVLQLFGIVFFISILTFIIPTYLEVERLKQFIKNEVEPYTESVEEYLPIISSFNDVVYQKDSLFTLHIKNDEDEFIIEGFLVASTKESKPVDSIYIFPHYITINNEEYKEISLIVEYDRPIKTEKNNKEIYSFDPAISKNNTPLKGLYASTYPYLENEIAMIKSLQFGVFVSKTNVISNFLIVTNDNEHPLIENYKYHYTLSELNIDLENNNLTNIISDKDNFPSETEKNIYNIDFKEFDKEAIKNYYKFGFLWYVFYGILLIPIAYFGYIRPIVSLKYSTKHKWFLTIYQVLDHILFLIH